MAENHFLTEGSECRCQFGSATDKIVVLTQTKDYINDSEGSRKLIASTKDIGVPFEKKTFGSCTVLHSSCVPAVTEWKEFYKNVTLTNQGKVLTVKSKAQCSIGGSPCITVVDHGQQAKITEVHFDQVQPETLTFLNPAAPPAGKKRKDPPKVKNIKLTCAREPNALHSKKNKQDQIVILQAGLNESLQFDVEEFINGTKCDKTFTGWKIIKDHCFDGTAETFENAGASFKVNFDELGKFRVIAFGAEGDSSEWQRCIDIEVVKNSIEGINIKDAALHGRTDSAGAIILRRGIPVALQAKYKFSPVSDEDRQHVKALITDRSGAVLASEDADTIQFTPANTAAEYVISFTKTVEASEEPVVVKKSIKTEANGVIAVKCQTEGEKSDHFVRPGTTMVFNVTEIDYGTLVNADAVELSAIQWKLNNVLLPTTGPKLTVPGTMLMVEKKYTVNAFVEGEKGGHKKDDWHFTVKKNELVSLEGPSEWVVGKGYNITAQTLMEYKKELDGPIKWTPADIDTTPLVCEGVYATGIGNFKVTAVLGTSTKVLTAKASLAKVTRWCFTDISNAYKPKAGWNEKLNALITCKEAAGEKVNIHLLEYDSANDSNYIKDLGEVTFDGNGDAKITFNTNDIKEKLSKLWFEERNGGYYDLYFAILKKADGIQFADMKTKTVEGKEYFFPAKESNHTNKETGKFVYISSTKEIVSVKFLDSTGYPAYKVYNYGEKITVHIQTKNMAGEEVQSTIIENIKDWLDKKIPGSKFKINDTEATERSIDTGVSQFKTGKTAAELNGIRMFYYQLKSSKADTIWFPPQIGDDKMFNTGNASFYNHIKLSAAAEAMNSKLGQLAPVVLGEALEGEKTPENKKCPRCEADITLAQIEEIFGKSTADVAFRNEILSYLNKYKNDFGINTCIAKAQFVAQFEAEHKMQKMWLIEGTVKYTEKNVRDDGTFGDRGKALSRRTDFSEICAERPEQIRLFSYIYSREGGHGNGNGNEASKDGYYYRGKGILQVTGRDNYKHAALALAKSCKSSLYQTLLNEETRNGYIIEVKEGSRQYKIFNFEGKPEMLGEYKYAVLSGLGDWLSKGLNAKVYMVDDDKTVKTQREVINNGFRKQQVVNGYHKTRITFKVAECINILASQTAPYDPNAKTHRYEIYIGTHKINKVENPGKNSKQFEYKVFDAANQLVHTYQLMANDNDLLPFPETGPNWGRFPATDSDRTASAGGDNWADETMTAKLLGLFYELPTVGYNYTLYYNDISAKDGRDIGHAGHRKGNDIDIRYPGVDGSNGEKLWTESLTQVGGKKEFERIMKIVFNTANDWGMHTNYSYKTDRPLFPNVINGAQDIHKNHFHLGYR